MSKKIEDAAMRAVEEYFSHSNRVDTFIVSNDKEPSWDGSLYLYNSTVEFNKSHKKDDLHSRIPTQVKGQSVQSFYGSEIHFSLNKSDLNNYLKDGGAVIFVAHIKKTLESKLYYCILLPYDLKKILNKKNDKKKFRITLKDINQYTASEFEAKLFQFTTDKEL